MADREIDQVPRTAPSSIPLSRRQILYGSAGLVVVGGLGACTGGEGGQYTGNNKKKPDVSGAASQISPTSRRQTVVVDQRGFTVFDKFNPFIPNGENYQGGVGQVAREYLWYLNMATGEIIPWLGKKWSYSDDYRELTLELNPKARWNDGKPFTSKDVKFSVELVKENPALLGGGTLVADLDSVETPNAQTVVFKLESSNPRAHYNFICDTVAPQVQIVPAHIWEKQDPTKFANNPPVYTGPYKLKQGIADRKMFVWERYDGYWNKDELDPKPRYVVYREAPAADAEFQQFKDAASDVTAEQPLYTLVKSAIDGGYKNAVITPMMDPCPDAMFLNADPSKGILADPRMRWVVSALTDRDKIGKSVWQIDTPGATYPWAAFENLKKFEIESIASKYPLSYDPKKAASLLDEMGARRGAGGKRRYRGKTLSFEIMTPAKDSDPEFFMVQMLAKELKKQGIGASIRNLPGSPVFAERVQKGNYDIRQEWHCGATLDPWQSYQTFQSKYARPVGKNSTQPSPYGNSIRLRDKGLDAAVGKLAKLDPNSAEAKDVLAEALEQWFQAMPAVMQIQKSFTHIFNTTFWTGWPTEKNLYMVPNNWWGQFLFVLGKLKPVGG